MIIVDVETSGVNALKNSILSIGAVDFLHPDIRFYEECRVWDGAHVDPEALAINGFTEEEIHDAKKQTEKELVARFLAWLNEREERTIAGQSTWFDLSFIQEAAYRGHVNIQIAHRSLDQHTIAYYHMVKRGITPPIEHNHSGLNSDTIMKYVGIPTEPRPHKAINGALWEAEAFSRLLYDKSLLPEFNSYPIPWLSGK